MVSILAIIVNSLSKQFYESFPNINHGSIVGVGHLLERKKVCFQGSMWLKGKILLTGAYYSYIVGTEEVNA